MNCYSKQCKGNNNENKLQQMDQRTRKLMTMHKALHLRDDIDRLVAATDLFPFANQCPC